MIKYLTLCADDFAQNAPISQGILALLQQRRLSATSCMSQSALWPTLAAELRCHAEQADIGLHFNLTHSFKKNQTYSLSKLMLNGVTRVISEQQAYSHLNEQLDLFEKHFGRAPDFIDGHQHVHQFAHIRTALIATLKQRYPTATPYIRSTLRGAKAPAYNIETVKSRIIQWFGGRPLRDAAERAQIVCNADFGGIYGLQPYSNFAEKMQVWLTNTQPNGLIMCHPGVNSDDPDDPIRLARAEEFTYLASDQFAQDLATANVQLSKLIRQ
ncbi:MAG TPA: ChbG/HpnK family deacetylase [Pseudomonadales bacterium]|nr:ChbG/HpnK family deacetylase [Pseudomonadales bacterium]